LVEPPYRTAPHQLQSICFNLLVEVIVSILTHPERLKWLRNRYEVARQLVHAGVGMQLASGSLTGAFGRNAQYWAHRMFDEGCVHDPADDAHDTHRRTPYLSRGRDAAAVCVGIEKANHLELTRPVGVI
jgi:protein-tyrosine phosphatase